MLCAQAWKPGSQHAGEKRGVAGLLLGADTAGQWSLALERSPLTSPVPTQSQRAPAQTWDSLMSLNFSKTSCIRQMSVWQTFLKIQSAAWLTVLLQASRAPLALALTAEGRSWPWAWLWAWPRPWAADHREAQDQNCHSHPDLQQPPL